MPLRQRFCIVFPINNSSVIGNYHTKISVFDLVVGNTLSNFHMKIISDNNLCDIPLGTRVSINIG